MGLNLRVVDRAGTTVDRTDATFDAVRDFACEHGLTALASVDTYDLTRFTRMQVRLIEPEVQTLLATGSPELAAPARELLRLIGIVERQPGRYLLFVGD